MIRQILGWSLLAAGFLAGIISNRSRLLARADRAKSEPWYTLTPWWDETLYGRLGRNEIRRSLRYALAGGLLIATSVVVLAL
jgi:hypothetical protein